MYSIVLQWCTVGEEQVGKKKKGDAKPRKTDGSELSKGQE